MRGAGVKYVRRRRRTRRDNENRERVGKDVGVGEVWKARDDDANEKGGVEGEANGEKESEVGRQRNLHERRRSIIWVVVKT